MKLKKKTLALLEKFNKIVFWQKDSKLSLNIARVLNTNRCNIISYSRSPYESFVMKENISSIIKKEPFSINDSTIIQYKDFHMNVYDEIINSKKYSGLAVCRLFQHEHFIL